MKHTYGALIAIGVTACAHGGGHHGVVMREDALGLSVVGEGEAEGTPDLAFFRVGVELRRPTAAQTREDAAKALQRVTQALARADVPARDVQTAQLSLAPDFEYSEAGRRLLGYVATNLLEVKLREMNRLATVLDATVTAGGADARLEGLSFELSNPETLRARARGLAVEHARSKARQLARKLGLQLGRIVAVEEMSATPQPGSPMMMRMQAANAETTTPVLPGSLKARAEVRVRWSLHH